MFNNNITLCKTISNKTGEMQIVPGLVILPGFGVFVDILG
jgi:hypothetical protein